MSRCVRGAFPCGEDRARGQNFEHRRGWIVSRIKELAHIFAIDVAAYMVMSNHYDVVAHIDCDRALDAAVYRPPAGGSLSLASARRYGVGRIGHGA